MFRTLTLSVLAAFAFTGCADLGDAPEATTTAVESSDLDNEEATFTGTALPIAAGDSTVTWIGAKLTGNHVGGFRNVTGDVYVEGEQVTGADVEIDMTSIYSDNEDLTGHLLSEDFFEVQTYPAGRFQTNQVRAIEAADSVSWAEATHMVTGRLTMHGQTNQITFPAIIQATDDGASIQSRFLIDRTNWGITYPGAQDDLINEQVRIELNVSTGDAATDPVAAEV